MRFLIIPFLFFIISAKGSIDYPIDFEESYRIFFEETLESTYPLLPKELKDYKVSFKVVTKKDRISKNICDPEKRELFAIATNIAGSKALTINSDLIRYAKDDKSEYDCMHRTYGKLLKATLLHELIHFYDSKHKLTKQKRFRSMVGGSTLFKQKQRRLHNNSASGSVDTYEYKNYKESFAVNFEYFVLDEEFKCQKPAYYQYFKEKLKLDPRPEKNCENFDYVLITEGDMKTNLSRKAKLDKKRLYQVHYLFAGKAKAIMSRWGHSMYRLVFCAPHRKKIGPECLDDVSHHLVISYRANVSDISINYMAGLFGKYPSQIFIYELSEVIQDYTRGELRDLWSAPLNLTKQERDNFLGLAIQKFWDYSGKYFFLTNNCATESKKHLQGSLVNPRKKVSSLTPLKMYRQFQAVERGYMDEGFMTSMTKNDLIKKGYLFESKRPGLVSSVKRLNNLGFNLPEEMEVLSEIAAVDRETQYSKVISSNFFINLSKAKKFISYLDLIKIEKYISGQYQVAVAEKIFKYARDNKDVMDKITSVTEGNPYFFLTQWNVVGSTNYGVPALKRIDAGLAKVKENRGKSDVQMDFINTLNGHAILDEIKSEVIRSEKIMLLLKRGMKENL